jgi:hypothetical protein
MEMESMAIVDHPLHHHPVSKMEFLMESIMFTFMEGISPHPHTGMIILAVKIWWLMRISFGRRTIKI